MYPARHTKPFVGVTLYFCRIENKFLSYAQPFNSELAKISVETLNSFAIARPFACGSFEITTVASTPVRSLVEMDCRMAFILLPLPEIKIASLSTLNKHTLEHA